MYFNFVSVIEFVDLSGILLFVVGAYVMIG